MLYLKDTEKWKQFTTGNSSSKITSGLCYISKILKNESNSQRQYSIYFPILRCVISQRYWKMKAIHNRSSASVLNEIVVLYLKDTEKWKQFTTRTQVKDGDGLLCYISKILKNESNSQHSITFHKSRNGCVISQRYWKMKAIHNNWQQATIKWTLCYISKILKNESNSQLLPLPLFLHLCCVISQRYWKMKAIHNAIPKPFNELKVVLYLKDTEKWKQFTTGTQLTQEFFRLCYISKILKNESNSQPKR